MKFTIVTFNETGDSVKALYKNDRLLFYGDSYHNKISEYIGGYINGFKNCSIDYNLVKPEVIELSCVDEELNINISEMAMCPPENLEDIKTK